MLPAGAAGAGNAATTARAACAAGANGIDPVASAASPTTGAAASGTIDFVFSDSLARLPNAAIGTGAAAEGAAGAATAAVSLPGRTYSPSSIMIRTTFFAAATCAGGATTSGTSFSSSMSGASPAVAADNAGADVASRDGSAPPALLLSGCELLEMRALSPPGDPDAAAQLMVLVLRLLLPAPPAFETASASIAGSDTAGTAIPVASGAPRANGDRASAAGLDRAATAGIELLRAAGAPATGLRLALDADHAAAAAAAAGDAGDRTASAAARGTAAGSALGSTYPPDGEPLELASRATTGDRPAEWAAPADRRESTDAERPSLGCGGVRSAGG